MRRVNHSGSYGAARRGARGVVAIIVALTLALLIAFTGLALDLGKLYVAKSELSNAADACALAAARDLTRAVSLATPEAAAMTVGSSNRVLLQGENVALATDSNVTFSRQFAGPYLTKDQFTTADVPAIGYVRCTVSRTRIPNWFMRVVDATLGTSAVAATAVASTTESQTTCALPVAICAPPAGSPYSVGQWVSSKVDSNTNQLNGSFMWVAYPGQNVPDMRTLLTGAGQCTLPTKGTNVGQTGNIQSMADAWNTRFGIYHGQYNPPPDPTGISDFTGFAYSPVTQLNGSIPTGNVFPDFRDNQRPKHTPYQGGPSTPDNLLDVQGTTQASTYYSTGADRRLALVPVVDCSVLQSPAHQAPILSWACILMLHPMEKGGSKSGLNGTVYLEYRGDASDPTTVCATQGIPGTTTAGIGPMVPVLVQ